MKEISNRPTEGYKVIAYLGNPLTINHPFPGETELPDDIAVSLRVGRSILGIEYFPQLQVNETTVSLSWSKDQIESMPSTCQIELFIAGISVLLSPMEVANSAVANPQTSLNIPLAINPQGVVSIPVNVVLKGNDGLSAYEDAVANHGFVGSSAEYQESLRGQDGTSYTESEEFNTLAAQINANADRAQQEANVAEDHADNAIGYRNETLGYRNEVIDLKAGTLQAAADALTNAGSGPVALASLNGVAVGGDGSAPGVLIPEIQYQHPRGDSEMLGNDTYRNAAVYGQGFYEQMAQAVLFNRVSANIWLFSTAAVTVRVYKSSAYSANPATLTLLEEKVMAAGTFNVTASTTTTINLDNTHWIGKDEFLYVFFHTATGNLLVINVYDAQAGAAPLRHAHLYTLTLSNPFASTWTPSSPPRYQTALRLSYVSELQQALESALTTDENGAVNDAYFPAVAYQHPRGDSEMLGNSTYSTKALGFYEQFTERMVFDRIVAPIYFPAASTVEMRLYKNTVHGVNIALHTLIQTKSFAAGVLSASSGSNSIIQLDTPVLIAADEFLYILFHVTGGSNGTIKRFTTAAGSAPARKSLLFSANTDPYSASWSSGSSSFLQAAFRLEKATPVESAAALTAVSARVTTLEGSVNTVGPRITITNTINALVGIELSLQYDALVLGWDKGLSSPVGWNVEIHCAKGRSYERQWSYTPESGDIGSTSLTIKVYNVQKALVQSKVVTLVTAAATGLGSAKNILDDGDSLTAANTKTTTIRSNFVAIGGTTPTFWGSQGSAPNKHEGRGGWSVLTFVSSGSPFYNAGGLDIANYRNTLGMGSAKFDLVNIQLGVNDSFGSALLPAGAATIITNLKSLLAAFLADNAATKIVVQLPTISGNTKGGWAANYAADYYKEIYMLNIWTIREAILSNFDSAAYHANVSVGIAGLVIDRYYGYARSARTISARYSDTEEAHTNALHPQSSGYQQMADGIFPQLLALLS